MQIENAQNGIVYDPNPVAMKAKATYACIELFQLCNLSSDFFLDFLSTWASVSIMLRYLKINII